MSTFTWVPDQGLTNSRKARVNRSTFGDGYSQRSADGINTIGSKLKLLFTVRTRAYIQEIDDFLVARNGVESFYYTIPGTSTPLRYTCDSWDPTYIHDGDASLSCEFTREFEP